MGVRDEIAPKGVSASSATCVAMFGFQDNME